MIDEERTGEAANAEDPGAPRAPAEPALRMPERPEPQAAPGGDRSAELEQQLLEKDRQLQRLAADFDNFRRRAASEKEELVRFAASRVMENFLPIVDNFERALAHATGAADASPLLQGVQLIMRQVEDFLARQGVAAMEPVGQAFDPNLHEAIGQVETTEFPDNAVVNQVQKGYFLNGRVVRHAMVQVASNPSGVPAAPTSQTEPATGEPGSPANDDELTLEDLMAEAQPSEGSKEETHG